MQFTVDGQSYEFDEDRMTFAQGRDVEKATGMTVKEVGESASRGSLTAVQALVWVAMKATRPALKFSDLDDLAIADVEFGSDEPAAGEAADPTPAAAAAS